MVPRIAVGQFQPTPDDRAHNLAMARERCREARDGRACLLVLPELALSGWLEEGRSDDQDAGAIAEPLDGPLVTAAATLAAEFRLTLIAGFYEQADDGEPRPYNTLGVFDPARGLIATHRKRHLFDAWDYHESRRVRAGAGANILVEAGGLRVGIMNCYEIRFPERAYGLVAAGAELLAVSAAWANGPLKEEHWILNLRARALENTVWLAASGTTGPAVVGHSAMIDPLGVVRAGLDERSAATSVVEVSTERTEWARRALPVLEQRRQVYGEPGGP